MRREKKKFQILLATMLRATGGAISRKIRFGTLILLIKVHIKYIT